MNCEAMCNHDHISNGVFAIEITIVYIVRVYDLLAQPP